MYIINLFYCSVTSEVLETTQKLFDYIKVAVSQLAIPGDQTFCENLLERWRETKQLSQSLSIHGQVDDQAMDILISSVCLISRIEVSPSCNHLCPHCGKQIGRSDQSQTSPLTESVTLSSGDHSCPDCLLLLQLTLVTTGLSQTGHSHQIIKNYEGLYKGLEWCVLKSNRYVAYAAVKCFQNCVKVDAFKTEELTCCLERFLHYMTYPKTNTGTEVTDTSCRPAVILDMFRHLSCCSEPVRSSCVQVLRKHWQTLYSSFIKNPDCSANLLSFLSLWKTLLGWSEKPALLFEMRKETWTDVLKIVVDVKLQSYVRLKAVSLLHKHLDSEERDTSSTEVSQTVIVWLVSGELSKLICTTKRQGFGWKLSPQDGELGKGINVQLTRKVCLLCLKALCQGIKHDAPCDKDTIHKALKEVLSYFKLELCPLHCWIKEIFCEQDDDWVLALLFVLDVYIYIVHRPGAWESLAMVDIKYIRDGYNVHRCFQQFLQTISYDHTVLLDLLSSPETQFLLFLIRYLKLVQKNWQDFVLSHEPPDHKQPNLFKISEPDNYLCSHYLGKSYFSKRGMIRENRSPESAANLHSDRADSVSHDTSDRADSVSHDTSDGTDAVSHDTSDRADSVSHKNSERVLTSGTSSHSSTDCQRVCAGSSCQEYLSVNCGNVSDVSGAESLLSMTSNITELNASCSTRKHGTMCNSPISSTSNDSSIRVDIDIPPSLDSPLDGDVPPSPDSPLDQTLTTLIRLRFGLEHLLDAGVFPYNAKPLLNALQCCEDLYESVERAKPI